ncbi:VOC family protein [Sporosarcina sp. Te-1]|uniref:VOC family protein n=1 Tax=Sporosarcina sp. Te-1 TaxID=2818390 RepID=UPI001A9CBF75|nr:VOC family protein [Sporosarcina sp. Te-1]QTD39691.1 VOC family protein [Sporosarcina sp. Te-1]
MIRKLGQVMLYVNDQEKAVTFWQEKVGFHVVADETAGPMRWIEIAPTKDSETSLVLHNKKAVARMSPDLHLGTPSLLFYSDRFEQLRRHLMDHQVTVGEIVDMPSGRTFNFADEEDNYFAVMEMK